ncbi:MAG TPA: hypothetical protein VHW23_41615 [Kofleriaceae bacterium]|nr:hypothetical protein [Kofleriaceae bacterium]
MIDALTVSVAGDGPTSCATSPFAISSPAFAVADDSSTAAARADDTVIERKIPDIRAS